MVSFACTFALVPFVCIIVSILCIQTLNFFFIHMHTRIFNSSSFTGNINGSYPELGRIFHVLYLIPK